jgi:hypothetical protein
MLGFRWPTDHAAAPSPRQDLPHHEVAVLLTQVLGAEGAPDLAVDLDRWVRHRLPRYQESRFRRRPVLAFAGGGIRLVPR